MNRPKLRHVVARGTQFLQTFRTDGYELFERVNKAVRARLRRYVAMALVDQTSASWNRLTSLLRKVEALRSAA